MQQQQHASSCSAGRRSGGARDRNPHRRKEFDKTRRASESYMCKSQDYGYSAVQPVPGTYCTEYQYLTRMYLKTNGRYNSEYTAVDLYLSCSCCRARVSALSTLNKPVRRTP